MLNNSIEFDKEVWKEKSVIKRTTSGRDRKKPQRYDGAEGRWR